MEAGTGRGGGVAGSQGTEENPALGQKFNMEGATWVHVSSNVIRDCNESSSGPLPSIQCRSDGRGWKGLIEYNKDNRCYYAEAFDHDSARSRFYAKASGVISLL